MGGIKFLLGGLTAHINSRIVTPAFILTTVIKRQKVDFIECDQMRYNSEEEAISWGTG